MTVPPRTDVAPGALVITADPPSMIGCSVLQYVVADDGTRALDTSTYTCGPTQCVHCTAMPAARRLHAPLLNRYARAHVRFRPFHQYANLRVSP